MATPEMIVRTADDETEEMTPEQVEQGMRVAWEALQAGPSYLERMDDETGRPHLFDVDPTDNKEWLS